MQALLFGVWDIPISDIRYPISEYAVFHLVIALVGFLAGFWKRWLIVVPIGTVIWFGVRDFQDFYRWNIDPPEWYVLGVGVCMAIAIIASIFGAILGSIRLRRASVRNA